MTTSASFGVLPYFLDRYKSHSRGSAVDVSSPARYRTWRRALLKKLKCLTGYDTMTPAPPRPRVTQTVRCDGYTRQRIVITTERGIDMPFYLLTPADYKKGQRRAAVLCPHGHASGGKLSPAGVREHSQPIANAITNYNYDYGVQYVRQGLITLCPDARGFGERIEPKTSASNKDNLLVSSCHYINQMAYPMGQTVTGMWAFDLHQLARYAQSRPDIDPERIACAGLSGGGLQTLWAAALDEDNLIKAAVISGYFYGYKESLLIQHQNCSCNYVPHLYETADMGDVGALIAPRPLLIETGDNDSLNGKSGVKNVTSQVAITRKAYKFLHAPGALVHDIFKGEHKWHGQLAVPWLAQQLAAMDA